MFCFALPTNTTYVTGNFAKNWPFFLTAVNRWKFVKHTFSYIYIKSVLKLETWPNEEKLAVYVQDQIKQPLEKNHQKLLYNTNNKGTLRRSERASIKNHPVAAGRSDTPSAACSPQINVIFFRSNVIIKIVELICHGKTDGAGQIIVLYFSSQVALGRVSFRTNGAASKNDAWAIDNGEYLLVKLANLSNFPGFSPQNINILFFEFSID